MSAAPAVTRQVARKRAALPAGGRASWCATATGRRRRTLEEVVLDLRERRGGIDLEDACAGDRRPVLGDVSRFDDDPAWHDALLFHQYFGGNSGAALGASHQTGWTGLVADLVVHLSRARENRAAS